MYEAYYQLNSDPFTLSPSGKDAYEHGSYKKTKAHLEYALYRGEGVVLITGQPGTGKTTLIKEVIRSLHGSKTVVLAFTCQMFTAKELVGQFAHALDVDIAKGELSNTLTNIQEALHQHRNEGHRALLILDEAQSLNDGALEQARLLSNFQAGDQPLIQIVLVGQPELRHKVLSPTLQQLHQRIVTSSDLQPLDAEQCRGYFLHRLTVAGWTGIPKVSDDIFALLHVASNGVPRWINQIGSRLLLHGMLEEKAELGSYDMRKIVDDLISESLLPQSVRAARLHAIAPGTAQKSDSEY
ncbi:AAA family ATPase [Granulosicoccus sp.]|nr:AAA family ATPase [Granulosicoccus sp.]